MQFCSWLVRNFALGSYAILLPNHRSYQFLLSNRCSYARPTGPPYMTVMVTGAESLVKTGLLQLLVASPLQALALADRNDASMSIRNGMMSMARKNMKMDVLAPYPSPTQDPLPVKPLTPTCETINPHTTRGLTLSGEPTTTSGATSPHWTNWNTTTEAASVCRVYMSTFWTRFVL